MAAAKFAIVTGSNTGLGLHLLKSLYGSGLYSTIVMMMACRSAEKAQLAIDDIQRQSASSATAPTAALKFIQLDLSSKSSVTKFAEEFTQISQPGSLHLLVNNAGIMGHPFKQVEGGLEIHFMTNHLGHFLLTNLLIENERFAENARILILSSGHYEKCKSLLSPEELKAEGPLMSPTEYYSHSKLANCLHAIALSKRLTANSTLKGVKVVAIRPGFVRGTELGRYFNPLLRTLATPLIWLFAKNLDQGISTALHCIQCDHSELANGALYYEKQVAAYNEIANEENAEKLWEISESMGSAL